MQPTPYGGATAAAGDRRLDNLALAFQEMFTVIERLRSNRQVVTDANMFRHQVREALKLCDQEARKRGYGQEEIQLAIFAAVAFLDESILNLHLPVFTDWARQPLQEELFGHHVAGEVFFQHVERMLAMHDSQSLADVLEVFELCLLLGFAGRYSIGSRGDLQATVQRIGEKIQRVRAMRLELSPAWAPGAAAGAKPGADPWVRIIGIAAVAIFVLAVGLFAGYKLALGSAVGGLHDVAAETRTAVAK